MTGESSSSSSSTDVPAFVLVASSRNTNVTGSGRYPWMSSRSMASMKQVPLRAMGTCALAGLSKKARVSTAMRLSTNRSGRTQALGSNSERWLSAKTTGRQPALRHHELPWWKSRRVWSASQTHWQTTRSLVPVCGRRISQSVSNLRWRCSILENDPNIERFEWYRHDARWSRLLASPAECLKFPPIPAHLVRVRFAPSPTGNLHVGGARTALFNWLYARNQGGHFIVRIEDTDQARSTRASEVAVLRDLRWLGLDWDEGPTYPDQPTTQAYLGERGPYRQSERAHIYEAVAALLIKAGAVYPCFCSEEALERKRRAAEAASQPPQYDGTCRDASPEHIVERLKRGDPYALRFRVPAESRVTIRDVVRGDVSWDAGATIGDFIIVRSSGVPVYNFCVAVDDALMGITTVIRAEEHLTNTLRQALILDALGYDRPQYAHVSLILGTDRQKLSKRHGATSIDQFAREGFLPEAMMNYLALLGWNDGTEREIYTPQELIQVFSLSRITKSAAVFDMNKLRWMNGLHLRSMQTEKLCGILTRFWLDAKIIRKPEETEDLYDAASAEQRDEHDSDSSKLYWEFTRHATGAASRFNRASQRLRSIAWGASPLPS
ncbi:Glutamyl-tRNA synthetase [Cyanidiococcus yangmingshanensis]|uniref:glutamate--tRNA ligase n=1 Tax=Cyanidiococcus yangmingshanensis TaxID=2690220 RepID=A0A7J7IFC4_9RHOD|nr:Glutamyl-tRNA synthetase [Cyanidiococcus yangmingshanensis]